MQYNYALWKKCNRIIVINYSSSANIQVWWGCLYAKKLRVGKGHDTGYKSFVYDYWGGVTIDFKFAEWCCKKDKVCSVKLSDSKAPQN